MIHRIVSDNESYIPYLNKDLIITACYFQEDKDIEPIYDLDLLGSDVVFPFSLYEWEFEEV
jgi:hypothetical protein